MKTLMGNAKNINLIIGLFILISFLLLMIVSFFYTPHDVTAMNVANKLKDQIVRIGLEPMNSAEISSVAL